MIIALKDKVVTLLRRGDVDTIAKAMVREAYKTPPGGGWSVLAMSYERYLKLLEEADAS